MQHFFKALLPLQTNLSEGFLTAPHTLQSKFSTFTQELTAKDCPNKLQFFPRSHQLFAALTHQKSPSPHTTWRKRGKTLMCTWGQELFANNSQRAPIRTVKWPLPSASLHFLAQWCFLSFLFFFCTRLNANPLYKEKSTVPSAWTLCTHVCVQPTSVQQIYLRQDVLQLSACFALLPFSHAWRDTGKDTVAPTLHKQRQPPPLWSTRLLLWPNTSFTSV